MNLAIVSRLKAAAAVAMVVSSVEAAGAAGMIGGTYQDQSSKTCNNCGELALEFGLAPDPSGLIIQTVACKFAGAGPPYEVKLHQSTNNSGYIFFPISFTGQDSSSNVWTANATGLHYGVPRAKAPRITVKSSFGLKLLQCGITGVMN